MTVRLAVAAFLATAIEISTLPAVAQTPGPSASPSPAASHAASPDPAPTLTLAPDDAVPNAYVHGQVLTIGKGYLVFTTGAALRLRAGTVIPKGTTIGSLVRATIDQLTRDVKAVELEPRITLAGEVEAAGLGKEFIVRTSSGAETVSAAGASEPLSNQVVNITLTVTVPANTPTGQDIYISTDRSSFSPSELRLQEIDARHYTTGLSLPLGSRLRYQYTRGYNSTVERERNGDVVKPHEFVVAPNEKVEDTVARWADLN